MGGCGIRSSSLQDSLSILQDFARKRVNCAENYSPFAYVCDRHWTLYSSENILQKNEVSQV